MPAELPPTILVVDDNRLVRELIRDTFVDAGFTVTTAENGHDALERVAIERPDLIVTDVAMPGMDGWEFCQRLQADPQARDVPIVFLSSERAVQDRIRGLRSGAYDYLCKPFSTEELLVRVRIILDRISSGSASREAPRSFLAGHTSHLPTADLVQLLSMNGKTGCLRLRSKELGRIHFRDGRIVGAFTARTSGRKALFRMLSWNDADFHFDPVDDLSVVDAFETDTQRLLMDALVALDDLERLRNGLPDPSLPLEPAEANEESARRRADLDPREQAVLRLASDRATMQEILDKVDGTDLDVARSLAELLECGLIVPAGGPSLTR